MKDSPYSKIGPDRTPPPDRSFFQVSLESFRATHKKTFGYEKSIFIIVKSRKWEQIKFCGRILGC